MPLVELKAAIEAARQFTVPLGAATFTLRLPSEHDCRVRLERHRDAAGVPLFTEAARALLDTALVGWSGVTEADLFEGAAATPLPFSVEARALLLDHRLDWADELTIALSAKRQQRAEQREAARKNSPSGSSGT